VSKLIASVGGEAIDTGDLATGGRLQGTTGQLANPMRMLTPAEARTLLDEALARLNTS